MQLCIVSEFNYIGPLGTNMNERDRDNVFYTHSVATLVVWLLMVTTAVSLASPVIAASGCEYGF